MKGRLRKKFGDSQGKRSLTIFDLYKMRGCKDEFQYSLIITPEGIFDKLLIKMFVE